MLAPTFVMAALTSPPPPQSYVRFCSQYQSMTNAQYQHALLADSDQENRLPDSVVLNAIRPQLPAPIELSVSLRQYNSMTGDRNGQKSAVVRVENRGETSYVVAEFSRNGQFIKTTPVSATVVERWYGFARAMAAYMLLNDLLASDTVVPRLGCARAAGIQLYAVAGILPSIQHAFLTIPEQDPDLLRLALGAYRNFTKSDEAQRNPLTRHTIEQLGNSPSIVLVYRSPDAASNAAQVVVRLSNGSVRTYAGVTVIANKAEMSSPGLCEVGDIRCAGDYSWP
jgi:hypothetical protein